MFKKLITMKTNYFYGLQIYRVLITKVTFNNINSYSIYLHLYKMWWDYICN